MPNIQVISRERHGKQYWQRVPHYKFAATDALCSLTIQELPKAMLTMPIALFKTEESYTPVLIQGLGPGKNLYVAANGNWVTGYIPAAYRGYPFVLANAEEGKRVLCYNEDSGLLSDTSGEPFFIEAGEPTEDIKSILNFLSQVDDNRLQTQHICAMLQKHNLIQPWPIKLKDGETEKNLEGLYRIDEAALNQLPSDSLAEVRNAGGLLLAYCQLLSMQHLPLLSQLTEAHAKADAQQAAALPTKGKDLDLSFMNDGETFKFS